jgi:MFS family permease
MAPHATPTSSWSPLRIRLFRSLWLATIVANVGTWMQEVGSGWLMTTLSPSPSMVALVSAAESIPIMLLALPAGAIADIVDRRRLLLAVESFAVVVAAALAAITWLGLTTPWVLLGFTFALGVCAALTMPAWSAIVPELVPPVELPAAIALNSVAINVSRALGPAIGGVLVATVGPWLVFLLNAVSSAGILAVLLRWKRPARKSSLPAERFTSAIRVGLRFVAHTRALQNVLVRGIAFFAFASATWSLLPLVVRSELARGPETYGILLACIGAGAVAGAMALPRLRARLSRDGMVAAASLLYAAAALALAHIRSVPLLAVAMLALGVAWIAILSTLQVAAQLTLPEWVRARGLAAFLTVFMGGMALGSILWGQVATFAGIPFALTAAAAGMALAVAATRRFGLGGKQVRDFTPTMAWPVPLLAAGSEPDSPTLVTIDYRVDPAGRADFIAAMQHVREMRRRNGAYYWELFHDSADPAQFREVFMDESWIEHLRQHERVSVGDQQVLQRAKQYLAGGEETHSAHWLAARID